MCDDCNENVNLDNLIANLPFLTRHIRSNVNENLNNLNANVNLPFPTRHVRCWLWMLGLSPPLLLAIFFCIFTRELFFFAIESNFSLSSFSAFNLIRFFSLHLWKGSVLSLSSFQWYLPLIAFSASPSWLKQDSIRWNTKMNNGKSRLRAWSQKGFSSTLSVHLVITNVIFSFKMAKHLCLIFLWNINMFFDLDIAAVKDYFLLKKVQCGFLLWNVRLDVFTSKQPKSQTLLMM